MTRFVTRCLVLVVAIASAGGSSVTADERLIVVAADGPGSAEQARAVMVDLGRILGAIDPRLAPIYADYCRDVASARDAIARDRPTFALLDLESFLALRRELAIHPLAQALPRGDVKARYRVIARVGGPATLEALRGRKLATSGVGSAAFLGAIALRTSEPPDTMFALVATRGGPLRALKMVARGDADGAVVDDGAWTALVAAQAGSPLSALAKDLVAIHAGPELPNALVARLGERGEGAALEAARRTDAALVAALVGLAASPPGKPLLETLTLSGFAAATAEDYAELVRADEAWRARFPLDPPKK